MTSIASSSDRASGGTDPALQPSGSSDRLLLTLNCVEERVQILLAREAALILHQEWAAPARVMRFLVPALDHALRSLGLKLRELDGIACVRGPGNFTGLRLCLATTCGLAMGAGLPMAGLDYLPLLAAGPASLVQGRLVVLTHARTRLVHAQPFRVGPLLSGPDAMVGPSVIPLAPPRLVAVDHSPDVQALLDGDDGPVYLLGSGIRRNLKWIHPGLWPQAKILEGSWDHPRCEVLIQAARGAVFGPAPIEPLYLRPCDAEENLEMFAAKHGFRPGEARERMRKEMGSAVEERA